MRFEPSDNEHFRELYERDGNGVCGVAVLAVIAGKNLSTILTLWDGDYIGYTCMKDMRSMLSKLGYASTLKSGGKSQSILSTARTIIARVQWLGEEGGKYHGYKSWHDACSQTHWILIQDDMVYCNSDGWFEKKQLKDYLKGGYITSYLEVGVYGI